MSDNKLAVFTFGRFNPPTLGHESLFNEVLSLTKRESFIFTSYSHDDDRNPLTVDEKIEFAERFYGVELIPAQTLTEALLHLKNIKLADEAIMVVGSDQYAEFKRLASFYSYHNDPAKRLPIPFTVREFIRPKEAISATKVRNAVGAEDFEQFSGMVGGSQSDKEELYELLKGRAYVKSQKIDRDG